LSNTTLPPCPISVVIHHPEQKVVILVEYVHTHILYLTGSHRQRYRAIREGSVA